MSEKCVLVPFFLCYHRKHVRFSTYSQREKSRPNIVKNFS